MCPTGWFVPTPGRPEVPRGSDDGQLRNRRAQGARRAMSGVLTRGTVKIDVEACKGCDLCIPACRPGVLVMTTDRFNQRGYRYPRAAGRLHRLPGLRPGVPGLRVPGMEVRLARRALQGPVPDSAVHREVEIQREQRI